MHCNINSMILRRTSRIFDATKLVNSRSVCLSNVMNTTTSAEPVKVIETKKSISKSMKAYLERAREHDQFMAERNYEYQIGKRHLANMMGEDPETFTQKDVDEAIEYLFPSALYDKLARPVMRPPDQIFPQRKAAEFDEAGRPHHFLFYTSRPNFYKLLYDVVEEINELNKFEDTMLQKNLSPDPNLKLELSGYQWIPKADLEKRLVEIISDKDYDNFINTMERLCSLPFAYKAKDFILTYRSPLMKQSSSTEVPKPHVDSDGRSYVTTYECLRKTARGHVTVKMPGTGLITINGEGIDYFKDVQSREQVLFPLLFANMLDKVDVEAHVEGGGFSGQAGAIRWGIAMSLRSFVDDETIEKMRVAGLLTRDYRIRERQKPGQFGARRKYTWKKR